jgi:hypothetical protein
MDSYEALKRSAFLDPIRNVVLVDDQFPSYENHASGSLPKNADTSKALKIFKHYADFNKICAVKSAQSLLSESQKRNLSNLDLLILDYNLIPDDDSDSSLARKIISSLADSPAFNIIIVYTQDRQISGNRCLEKVTLEIAASLKNKIESSTLEENPNLLFDDDSEHPDFAEELEQQMTNAIKADYLSDRKTDLISDLYKTVSKRLPCHLRRYTREYSEWLIQNELENVGQYQIDTTLSISLETHPIIWGQNFLLVAINKETEPDQFSTILENSIDKISLNPVQLALQGMLNIANANAPTHIANVVQNKSLMAGLMLELVSDSDATKLASRTLQELSAQIVTDWASKQGDDFMSELLVSPRDFLLEHASMDVDNLGTKLSVIHELNRHLCTFSSTVAVHLTTGIILHDKNENNYWVVLNCSCDLVPDQQPTHWKSKASGFQPFTALKLTTRACIETPLKNATDCLYVFIKDNEEMKALSYPPPPQKPYYETFYAENNGEFESGKVQVRHFVNNFTCIPEELPTLKHAEFRVVAQMRYEYATRFLNMLSAHKSRVGVDYVNLEHA